MFTQIRSRARRSLAALTAAVLFAGVTVAGAAMPAAAEAIPTATANPVLTVTPGEVSDVTKEVALTVSGTGYVGDGAASGAYILVGGLDVWTPGSGPLVADGWAAQGWVSAGQIKDGAFTTVVKVPADVLEAGQTYQVASSAAHGLSATNRTLDAQVKFTTKDQEPPAPIADPKLTVTPGEVSDVTKEVALTVSGTGYVGDGAASGAYILVGGLDVWTPGSGPLVADGWAAQGWVSAGQIKDGAFTTVVKVPADVLDAGQTYQVASSAAHGLSATNRSLDAQVKFTTKDQEPPAPAPQAVVKVSKTDGLNPEGETITVTGSGFLPAADGATTGVRPPLAGKFTGAYVVLGDFADVWKPTEGAPSSARKSLSQFWAVPAESMQVIGGPAAGAVELKADGTFSVEFEVKKGAEITGNLGIYTYPGGGSKYAQFETFTPLTFADDSGPEKPGADPVLMVSPKVIDDVTKDSMLTVSGTGYVGEGAKMGAYILVGDKALWTPGSGKPLVADGWAALSWVPANKIVDGKFTVDVKVPADKLEGGKEYQVASSAAHQLSATDRSLDAQALIITKAKDGVDPDPKPGPDPKPDPEPQEGGLVWGIDKTFVDYIPGPIAKGKIVVSQGAAFAKGLFTFPQNGEATAGTGTAKFSGNVAFSGHNGALDSQFGALELKFLGNNSAELLGTVTANAMSGESLLENDKVVIAKVNLNAAVTNKDKSVTYTSNGVTLTADGAKAFGNYYSAGQKVSELTFTVGSASGVDTGKPPVEVTEKPKGEEEESGKTPGGVVTAPDITGKQPEVCVARAVSGATMNWNFKSSFVRYVGGLNDGKISASGVSQGNGFTWSGGTGKYNEAASKGLINFGGTVQFTGHAGVMNAKFSNMRVQFLGANSAALIADVVSSDMSGNAVTLAGAQIATISLSGKKATSGSAVTWSNAPVTLTSAGAKAFGGFYNAGEALDPITITAPLGANTDCDASTGTLAATGLSEQTTGVVGIAIAFLAAGAAVLTANRRKFARVRE